MRKRMTLLLLAALMLLCACHRPKEQKTPEHPFTFYYPRTSVTYDTPDGVLCPEQREFDLQTKTLDDLLTAYFEGPEASSLSMPFPEQVQMSVYRREDTTLILSANEPYRRLSGIGKSIADSSLARTLFGYGFERVTILATDGTMTTLTKKNLVLSDTGAEVQDTSVTLYFADAEGRFLLPEQRSTEPLDEVQIPQYILEQLIAGTTRRGYGNLIPEGTKLLSVKTENGLCTVDFSPEFLTNSPQTHSLERLTIYSIVNSLTELETVDSVQILADGETVEYYFRMSLAEPFVRDETMLGPINAASGEISAELCVYDGSSLLPIAAILPVPENGKEAEVILQALIDFAPYNVYQNVLPEDTSVRTASVSGALCKVDLSGEGLLNMTPEQLELALKSVAATLCRSGVADAALITVDGNAQPGDFSRPIVPADDWISD